MIRPEGRKAALWNQRGTVIVLASVSLAAMLAFTALAIDIGHYWVVRNELQNAADAGARRRQPFVSAHADFVYPQSDPRLGDGGSGSHADGSAQ